MTILEQLTALETIINNAKGDATKFDAGGKGSNGAGTRVRGAMQELKRAAQSIRGSVLETKTAVA